LGFADRLPIPIYWNSGRGIQQREWKTKNGKRINQFTICYSPFTTLTATGIAPDFNRIPFSFPPEAGNQIIANVVREANDARRVFNNAVISIYSMLFRKCLLLIAKEYCVILEKFRHLNIKGSANSI